MSEEDWRDESQRLSSLFSKFSQKEEYDKTSDVTFTLPDGSKLRAHKLVLSVSSEVFYAQFYGPLADKSHDVKISQCISASAFRVMVDSIYRSGEIHPELGIEELLDLLFCSNFYLLHGNIRWCTYKIVNYIGDIQDVPELAMWALKLSQLTIHDNLFSFCRDVILSKLPIILKEDKWMVFDEHVQDQLLDDLRCSVMGFNWDMEIDKDHYWRMVDFSKKNDIKTLQDYCLEKIKECLPRCFPVLLSHHINKASLTSGAEELFNEGIRIFVDSTTSFRWYIVDVYEDEYDVMMAWKSLTKKAVEEILEVMKNLEEDDKTLILNGVKLWTKVHASSKVEEDEILMKDSSSETS